MLTFTIGHNKTISVLVGSTTKSVPAEHPYYEEILEAIRNNDEETVLSLCDRAAQLHTMSNGFFRVDDGQVFTQDEAGNEFPLPSVLNDEVIKYMEMNLDFERLIKFAQNLDQNPSKRAVDELFTWIKKAGLTITEDGCFIAYKGVKRGPTAKLPEAEFVDIHSGTFDNSVGKVCKIKRNQVDENSDVACSYGLHVANYDYAHNFMASSNGAVVLCKVHPKDVVAVPKYETTKMRVCEYEVVGLSDGPIGKPQWDRSESSSFGGDDDDDDDDYEKDYCDECGADEDEAFGCDDPDCPMNY